MPDILYAAALDKQVFAESQLSTASAQQTQKNSERVTALSTLTAACNCYSNLNNCCLCCWCNCEACVAALKVPVAQTECYEIQDCLYQCPVDPDAWNLIPDNTGQPGWNTFWVCDTSGYYRCGKGCSWTVPAGVTCVQFDMWGVGGNNSSGYCCGGAPWGPNGSFGSIVMPVSAGCSYTICGGCALCCAHGPSYHDQAFPSGSATYVSGYGLQNVCIQPALNNFPRLYNHCIGLTVNCRAYNCAGGSGQCWCGFGWFCQDNSCATCGVRCAAHTNVWPQGRVCVPNAHYYRTTGAGGCYCRDTNAYGWFRNITVPRMYCCTCQCLCRYFDSSTCGGWLYGYECYGGKTCMPGIGSEPLTVMGSCTSMYSGYPNMGAVRVTYYCNC